VHRDVFGAGELNDLNEIARAAGLNPEVAESPLNFRSNYDRRPGWAEYYLGKIEELSTDERMVTDKMPTNFRWLGLINVLFPDARIIHIQRNPLDTCLSCYFKDFSGVHTYAYSLENLGAYYRDYTRLMAHWRGVLTLPMLEIKYEELVNDTESVSKAMLAFCGLEWDERVLHFHKSDRLVTTASYDQVRKPIYKSALGRWQAYRPYLEPLCRALGDACPEMCPPGREQDTQA
jgi:hypothetical protein